MREYRAGDKVTVSLFRNDGLLRLRARLSNPPEDTCWLEVDSDRSEAAEQRQSSWIAGS
jgi:hypothetical protein